jgi:lysophospholipase L1-like esterase
MPFKILALGDSVVWGQGLQEAHKFDRQIAAIIGQGGQPVELASLARSGAIIDLQPAAPALHTPFLFGELPRSLPSILSELATAATTAGFGPYLQPQPWDPREWVAAKQDLARQIAGYAQQGPDLILLDGGINDLKALQIILPWNLHESAAPGLATAGLFTSTADRVLSALRQAAGRVENLALPELHWLTDDEFKAMIDQFVFQRMQTLLARVAAAFPRSRVIVTGYFPIFTEGSLQPLLQLNPAVATLIAPSSNRREQLAALTTALDPHLDKERYANLIIHRSALWYRFGTDRLAEAVAQANASFGQRFALASPKFGPDNGALAPDSFLWTLTPGVDKILQKLLRLLGGGSVPHAEVTDLERPAALALGGLDYAAGYALGAGLATDERVVDRAEAATQYYVASGIGHSDPDATLVNGFTNSIASVGHPNPTGAKAYVEAIQGVL